MSILALILSFCLQVPQQTPDSVFSTCQGRVVQVWTKGKDEDKFSFNGTGFIATLKDKVVVITARHVVKEADKEELHLGNRKLRTKVLYTGKNADFAVLEWTGKDAAVPFNLTNDAPVIGQNVYVIGFPSPGNTVFGPVLTTGIVNQGLTKTDSDTDPDEVLLGISCLLVGGNSGSPVINDKLDAIGVAVAGYAATPLNFAVPVSAIYAEDIKF